MAVLPENAEWVDGIYQLETTDPVVGGPPNLALGRGIDNVQAQQLAQRTGFLREALAAYTALDGATVGAGKTVWSSDGFLMVNTTSNDITITGRDKATLESNGLVEFFEWFRSKIIGTASPAGAIMAFAMSDPPEGWLECNGAVLSKVRYDKLFAAIGITFGGTETSASFRVPDLRGEFLRGWDHGRGVDNGRLFGSAQAATGIRTLIDNFNGYGVGTYAIGMRNHDGPITGGGSDSNTFGKDNEYYSHTATTRYGSGDNAGYFVRPRNVALMFCIKY